MRTPVVEIESQLFGFDALSGAPADQLSGAVSARFDGELLWRYEAGWITLTESSQTTVAALRSIYALLSRWARGSFAWHGPVHPWEHAERDLFGLDTHDVWADHVVSGRNQQDVEEALGRCLAQMLFPTEECVRAVAEVLDRSPVRTRIVVSSVDPVIQALPFELARVGGDLVVERRSVSFVRRAACLAGAPPVNARMHGLPMIRSSAVACQPGPLDRVALGDAATACRNADSELLDQPSIEDLSAFLRTRPADLTVLSCHAFVGKSPTERHAILQFIRQEGDQAAIGTRGMVPDEILDALRAAPRLPTGIFVNACLSAVGGPRASSLTRSIAGLGVAFVVGWQDLVLDPLATELVAVALPAFHDGEDLEWVVAAWRCASECTRRWALVTWMREECDWQPPPVVPRPRLLHTTRSAELPDSVSSNGVGIGEGFASCGQLLHWSVGNELWQGSIPLNRTVRLAVSIEPTIELGCGVAVESARSERGHAVGALLTGVWHALVEAQSTLHPTALRVRIERELPEQLDDDAAYLSAFVLAIQDLYGTFPDPSTAASALAQVAPSAPWQGVSGDRPCTVVQRTHPGFALLASLEPVGEASVRFLRARVANPEPTTHRDPRRARRLLHDLVDDIGTRGAAAMLDHCDAYARSIAPASVTHELPSNVRLALTWDGRLAALSLSESDVGEIGIHRADARRFTTA
jgi:hypothetical protein